MKVVTFLFIFLLLNERSVRAKSASFWVKLGREGGIDSDILHWKIRPIQKISNQAYGILPVAQTSGFFGLNPWAYPYSSETPPTPGMSWEFGTGNEAAS